jgi:hypothetical protein
MESMKVRNLRREIEEQLPKELQTLRLFIEADMRKLKAPNEEAPEPAKKSKERNKLALESSR